MPNLVYKSGKVTDIIVLNDAEIRVKTDNARLDEVQIFSVAGSVSGEYDTVNNTATVHDPQANFVSLKQRLDQRKATKVKIGYDESVAGSVKPICDFSYSAVLLGATVQPTDATLPR